MLIETLAPPARPHTVARLPLWRVFVSRCGPRLFVFITDAIPRPQLAQLHDHTLSIELNLRFPFLPCSGLGRGGGLQGGEPALDDQMHGY